MRRPGHDGRRRFLIRSPTRVLPIRCVQNAVHALILVGPFPRPKERRLMALTNIEWTGTPLPNGTILPGYSFNTHWGCFKVSPGCTNCYAEGQAKCYGHDIWGPAATTERRLFGDAHWREPLAWNAQAHASGIRRKVFANSFSDWAEDHPQLDPVRERMWELIRATPNLDWLLL